MAMDQCLYIPFLGDEHPFTSYFDVHQGYKVLTHCQIKDDIGDLVLSTYLEILDPDRHRINQQVSENLLHGQGFSDVDYGSFFPGYQSENNLLTIILAVPQSCFTSLSG